MKNLYMVYKITVKDKDGKEILSKEYESRSFVKNFMLLVHSSMVGEWVIVVDTSGNSVNATITEKWCVAGSGPGQSPGRLLVNAPEGDDSYGIVVGTGTTPVSPDDYNLESKIPHGSGDNQLYYLKTSVGSVVVEDNSVKINISRVFRNDGSVDIMINEIGLVAKVRASDGSSPNVLIVRDVLPEPVEIPSGGGLAIVSYEVIAL